MRGSEHRSHNALGGHSRRPHQPPHGGHGMMPPPPPPRTPRQARQFAGRYRRSCCCLTGLFSALGTWLTGLFR